MKKDTVITNNLRDELKSILEKEIQKIPEYLNDLEPKEKLNFICKLAPFVLPKVQTIHPTEGEPLYL